MAHKTDVREETALAAVHNDDQSITDEDTDLSNVSPQLAAILKPGSKGRKAIHDDSLTSDERAQLAREVRDYRLASVIELDLLCARVNAPYALVLCPATT